MLVTEKYTDLYQSPHKMKKQLCLGRPRKSMSYCPSIKLLCLLTRCSSYASILQWMSYCNQEITNHLGSWTRPLLGLEPYNKEAVAAHKQAALKAIDVLENYLLHNTYLVGQRITLADIFCTSLLYRGFQNVSTSMHCLRRGTLTMLRSGL
jgi:glutathione S-transferase